MKTDMQIITVPDFMIVPKTIASHTNITMAELHFETRVSYCHLQNMKKVLENKGWINITQEGKRHLFNITEPGKAVVSAIDVLLNVLGITEDDIKEYKTRSKISTKKNTTIVIDEAPKLLSDNIPEVTEEGILPEPIKQEDVFEQGMKEVYGTKFVEVENEGVNEEDKENDANTTYRDSY